MNITVNYLSQFTTICIANNTHKLIIGMHICLFTKNNLQKDAMRLHHI